MNEPLKKYVVDKLSLSEDHADWDYPSFSEPVRIYLAAEVEQVLREYAEAKTDFNAHRLDRGRQSPIRWQRLIHAEIAIIDLARLEGE